MGASQHEGIDPGTPQPCKIFFRHQPGDGSIGFAFLHQGDKQRTGLGNDLLRSPAHRGKCFPDARLIRPAADGGRSRDHANAAIPSRRHRGAGSWTDHAENRHPGKVLPQARCGDGRGGVAGNHDHLDPPPHQKLDILLRITADGGMRFIAIGHPGGVPQINEVLGGEQAAQFAHDGEAAHAGIEDANRK